MGDQGGRSRWRSAAAVLVMLLLSVGVALPAAIALAPTQETTVAGQYLGVGGTTPDGGWLGDLGDLADALRAGGPTTWPGAVADGFTGPAVLEQIGNTTVDVPRVQVHGPLRPLLTLGPLVRTREADELLDPRTGSAARDAALGSITSAFERWYVVATLLVLLFSLATIALVTTVRIWASLGRASRRQRDLTVSAVWHGRSRTLRRDALVALLGTVLAWGGVSAAAWHGTTEGLQGISSARDLVGASPVKLAQRGPDVSGYAGAVIGDSRASRLGGPLVGDPSRGDQACGRSTDSLAAQLTQLDPTAPVVNLACPSATIASGLLGEQSRDGTTLRPQVERLLQLRDLRFVVVMIGPNDLAWADFLRYCYGVSTCNDRFTEGQFDYRLAHFDRDYGDLLAALADLPDHPAVVVVGSYDVFEPDDQCAATEGPPGVPGLDADGISLLIERNQQLNDVLAAGAAAYGFDLAVPRLGTLCAPSDPDVGPDLQDLEARYPFHPTGVGMVRLGASVYAEVEKAEAAAAAPASVTE